ncbi:helix-turn-helix domain-containing protein [Streptomyces canus]|uniref:helix-turn-helix domain-containing protein n=1 Tax=Streptomyces canus TaxID=58343 RepID=UPI0030DDF13A
MNTTTAAAQANVSLTTIRTWCRTGAIAAVKQAGRWIIDGASLAARVAALKAQRTGQLWVTGKERSGWFVKNNVTGAIYTGLVHVGAISLASHLNRQAA